MLPASIVPIFLNFLSKINLYWFFFGVFQTYVPMMMWIVVFFYWHNVIHSSPTRRILFYGSNLKSQIFIRLWVNYYHQRDDEYWTFDVHVAVVASRSIGCLLRFIYSRACSMNRIIIWLMLEHDWAHGK